MRQGDFFVCDIVDVMPKSDMASMEHPIYSVTTQKDTETRTFHTGKNSLTVIPDPNHGLPSIHDKDVMIYAISQLMAGVNEGRDVSNTVAITAYDLLKATNRNHGGTDYARLRQALMRLSGTKINTNIEIGDYTVEHVFPLITDWRSLRETKSGQLILLSVTLHEWVFRAIQSKEVLSLHRDYFRLPALERRLYELARKHTGKQPKWSCGLEKLREKLGYKSPLRNVAVKIRKAAKENAIPDFNMTYDDGRKVLTMTPRGEAVPSIEVPPLPTEVIEEGKRLVLSHGLDIYAVKDAWETALKGRGKVPKDVPKSFLAYVRGRVDKHDRAGDGRFERE